MKGLLTLMLLIVSVNIYASDGIVSNHQCINAYREAFTTLKEIVDDYNQDRVDRIEFATIVTGNSTRLGAKRAACSVFENPAVASCVNNYKGLYQELRKRINLRAIIVGNQDQITYTEQMEEVIEVHQQEEHPANWFQGVRNFIRTGSAVAREEVQQTKLVAKLAIFDEKCGF